MKWSDIDWRKLEQDTRRNLLLMRQIERDMHAAGIPLPQKRALVAQAEQALFGNVSYVM